MKVGGAPFEVCCLWLVSLACGLEGPDSDTRTQGDTASESACSLLGLVTNCPSSSLSALEPSLLGEVHRHSQQTHGCWRGPAEGAGVPGFGHRHARLGPCALQVAGKGKDRTEAPRPLPAGPLSGLGQQPRVPPGVKHVTTLCTIISSPVPAPQL